MSYIVELTNTADKQLEKLDQKQQDRINNALLDLCEFYDGLSNKKPDVKPLTGKYDGLLNLSVQHLCFNERLHTCLLESLIYPQVKFCVAS